mgnify:FL=1
MLNSVRSSTFSRAYIDFKNADDVIEFHQEFNGHMFVNEKGKAKILFSRRYFLRGMGTWFHISMLILIGTQYKAMVEYAPNQRAPKIWAKKDTREGTIFQGNLNIYTTECKVVAPLLVRLH